MKNQTHNRFYHEILPGIFVLLLLALIAGASAARAGLQAGEDAPLFSKPATTGESFKLDRNSTDTVLLVFTRPDDRFTSDALRALEHVFAAYPPLQKGMRIGIVVSLIDNEGQAAAFRKKVDAQWPVIADSDNELYKSYKIIATPTVVIIGSGRKVAAVHPGYDPSLAEDVRGAIAKTRGMTLPEAMTGPSAKPNMTLQLGRRMAARGLWEDALKYYTDAAKQGPLPAVAQVELAEIHLELNDPGAALAIVNALPAEMKGQERVKKIITRAEAIKSGRSVMPTPPPIKR